MTTVNHQCSKCLVTVWLQEIDDGKQRWRGAADADCGCTSRDESADPYDDDDD